jgi:putative two-component system response regulator
MEDDKKKTILLVDDDPVNIQVLSILLGDKYNIMVASSGAQALQLATEQPDLILLDIIMPEMDGYEVCRRLKSAPAISGIPVIFVTGMNDPEDEIKGLSLGAVDYFIKPLHAAITLARIKNHLELHQFRDELQEMNRNLKQQVRNEAIQNTNSSLNSHL